MRGSTACCRRSGEMGRPARHVEDVLTGQDSSGFQQGCNVGRCRMGETVSVARRGPLPAGMLKGAHGSGFKAHKSASCLKIGPCWHLSKSTGACRDAGLPVSWEEADIN